MRIAVIGGSTAGLATALRLQQSGHEVSVWERRAGAPTGGFGLLLTPSVYHSLEQIGVDLGHRVHAIEQCQILESEGTSLLSQPMHSTAGVERKALVEELMSALQPGTLQTGTSFVDFERDERGIATAALFDDGRRQSADLFIGADGVRSRVRKHHVPGTALTPVRTVELVGMCQGDRVPEAMRGRFLKAIRPGDGIAIGLVPASDNSIVWYIQCDPRRWPQVLLPLQQRQNWLLDELRHWPTLIEETIAGSDLPRVHLWRTTDRDLPTTFHRGNVLLVGDAAHPLLTFTSQGTGSAIEDALAIGDLLDDHDLADAGAMDRTLGAFARFRRPVLQKRLQMGRRMQREFLRPSRRSLLEVPVCC